MKLFEIMPCRLLSIQSTIDGYVHSKTPLISYNDKCNLGENAGIGPAGLSEEPGAYYFIPKIVELTGFNLETAVNFTEELLLLLIWWSHWQLEILWNPIRKWISLFALWILCIVIAGISIYVVRVSTVALVPWLLLVQKHLI